MVHGLVLSTTFHGRLCTSNTLLERCSHLRYFQVRNHLRFPASSINRTTTLRLQAAPTGACSQPSKLADGSWDNLGIDPVPTDYIYIMKSSGNGEFSGGSLQQFGNIEMNPSACVLNYGE